MTRNAHQNYRPDIDGLRAVAVALVILVHAFPNYVPAGFIGVDIFFVISGYLITGLILKELSQDNFSFRKFYAHRFRRIAPALSIVLVSVWVMGWWILLSDEFVALAKQVVAGATYVCNILFWREAGYFDLASERKPLLHLWSLGVEEQFYLVWPALLFLWHRRKWNIEKLIVSLVIMSFLFNVLRVQQHTTEVFYVLQSRFWELLFGCWLAYRENLQPRSEKLSGFGNLQSNNIKSAIAAVLLVTSILTITSEKLFPGWWAVLPVSSAFLFIWAGPKAWVNKYILSQPILVFIGLISYPLYLWHWPFLSYLYIAENHGPNITAPIIWTTILLSCFLAWVTHKWIELPVRDTLFKSKSPVQRQTNYIVSAFVAIAVISSLGLITIKYEGFGFRFEEYEKRNAQFKWTFEEDKNCRSLFGYQYESFCIHNDPKPQVMILGDSHGNHLYGGMATIPHPFKLIQVGTCAPVDSVIYDRYTQDSNPCIHYPEMWAFNKKLMTEVLPTVKLVILAAFWPTYIPGGKLTPDDRVIWKFQPVDEKESGHSQEQIFEAALSRTISYVESKSKQAIFYLDTPELDFYPDSCIDGRPLKLRSLVTKDPCVMPLEIVMKRQEASRRIAERLKIRHPKLKVFDPLPYFCNKQYCEAKSEGNILYRDAHHLSIYGSQQLALRFSEWLKNEGIEL
jgi:peptidoglycan/LPS O-acetylase OafA/YrhL